MSDYVITRLMNEFCCQNCHAVEANCVYRLHVINYLVLKH